MRLSFAALIALGAVSCSESVTPPMSSGPNEPPHIRIRNVYGENWEVPYSFRVRWTGTDPDGDRLLYRARLDDGDWIETLETSIALDELTDQLGFHTFTVEAIDARGLYSEPAIATVATRNLVPTVRFSGGWTSEYPPDRGMRLYCPYPIQWTGNDEYSESLRYQWRLVALERGDLTDVEIIERVRDPANENLSIPRELLYANPTGLILQSGDWYPPEALITSEAELRLVLPPKEGRWFAFAVRAIDERGEVTDRFGVHQRDGPTGWRAGNVLLVQRAESYPDGPAMVVRIRTEDGSYDVEETLLDGDVWRVPVPRNRPFELGWYPLSTCTGVGDGQAAFAFEPACDTCEDWWGSYGWSPWTGGYSWRSMVLREDDFVSFQLRGRWSEDSEVGTHSVVQPD